MDLFFTFLRDNLIGVIVDLIVALVFLLVYSIYEIQKEAFLYALVLALLLKIIYFIYRFYKYKKHVNALKMIENSLFSEDISAMDYNDSISDCYRKLLIKQNKETALMENLYENDLKNNEEFFIMWTHQVKLPISAMKLNLETSKEVDKAQVRAQLNRIDQYTKMVLAFIRLGSENLDFVFEEVDLDTMIRNSIKTFKIEFIHKKLSVDFKPTSRMIITDKKWFEFALEQVISNSLKYTKTGGISIFVKDDYLNIADTGIGINKADIPRVFERGFTGYNGRISSESSGLGLYLIKEILTKLHHDVKLDSSVNIGTTIGIGLKRYDFKAE